MTKVASASDPISLLAQSAPEFGATVVAHNAALLEISLPVISADGSVRTYRLALKASGATATVKEVTASNLPGFCPERHINLGGAFCLSWQPIDSLDIRDAADAEAWFEVLVRFLQMQVRAARQRRWPGRTARAHGDAAVHQHRAEAAAARLGDRFDAAIRDGRLTAVAGGSGGNGRAVRVMRDGLREYAVWMRSRRPVNLRRPCICDKAGRRIVIRDCEDHAALASQLAIELYAMLDEDARFWRIVEDEPCCGTMDGCRLAIESAATASAGNTADDKKMTL